MKCDKVQELLLTDYLDGELEQQIAKGVDQHLLECRECRAFKEAVLAQSVVPFKDAKDPVVPATVWDGIAQAIDAEERGALRVTVRDRMTDFFDSVLAPFKLKTPAIAFASTIIVAFMVMIFVYHPAVPDPYVSQIMGEQMDFLTSLSANGLAENSTTSVELDTTIEYFFL